MRWSRGSALFLAGLLTLTGPVAAEGVQDVLPPSELRGAYDESAQEMHLTWQAPTDGLDYQYTVYRNGEALHTTHATNYTDPLNVSLANVGVTTYHVTATPTEGGFAGQESAPSAPLLAWNGPMDGPCNPLFIGVYVGPPFVAYSIRWECIPLPFAGGSLVGLVPDNFMEVRGR